MAANTILTLSNGKGIDLTNPRAADIDFTVIAEHLSKEKRYNGATPGIEYPVAQHCCIGADAILADLGDKTLAAYFLLHDAPEAFLKDDTTPKKRALAEVAARNFGVLADEIIAAFDMLTEQFDAAIHEAAGLVWPMPPAIKAAVKAYDLTMFVTEWRDLMRGTQHPNWDEYRDIAPLRDRIIVWPWQTACGGYIGRCKDLLPALGGGR
jgi:5'-deoxynucleotidase YfbR-like HD superfamily hydrolase